MKYATRMFLLTLTMLPLFAAAQLNSSDKIVTQVPFAFMVGNKVLPSGQWTVQPATDNSRTLTIRNAEAKMSMFSTASATEGKKTAANYALVFNKLDGRYFLSAIKIEGARTIYRLPVSRAEAELRAQNVPATEETLLASLK